jgi:hypothetical protein
LLKGNERHGEFDYPDEEYRYYVLAKKFGWTPTQADQESAVMLDWLIAIAGVVDEVKAEAYDG